MEEKKQRNKFYSAWAKGIVIALFLTAVACFSVFAMIFGGLMCQGFSWEELTSNYYNEKNYLETQDYQKLLERQVKQAVEFAGNDQMIIYLDPVDEDKLNRLALHNGNAELRISEYSFTGGTRAVIPARHILIDNSFQTKLEEAREKFHFDLSLTEGGRDHV